MLCISSKLRPSWIFLLKNCVIWTLSTGPTLFLPVLENRTLWRCLITISVVLSIIRILFLLVTAVNISTIAIGPPILKTGLKCMHRLWDRTDGPVWYILWKVVMYPELLLWNSMSAWPTWNTGTTSINGWRSGRGKNWWCMYLRKKPINTRIRLLIPVRKIT